MKNISGYMKEYSDETDKNFFGSPEAKIVQGIGVLMIFAVHFLTHFYFSMENREIYKWCDLTVRGLTIELHIQKTAQLCRALFAFITGCAIYVKREKYKSICYCLKKTSQFLIKYWIVLFAIYFAGWCVGEPLPNRTTLRFHLLGSSPSSDVVYPAFMAYVCFYVFLVMLAPLWVRLFEHGIVVETIALILIKAVYSCVAPFIKWPILGIGLSVCTSYLGGGGGNWVCSKAIWAV